MASTDAPRTGEVAYWNADKGFGFIASEGGKRVFFHASHMARAGRGAVHPSVGDPVTFGVGQDGDGRTSARNVTVVGDVAVVPDQPRAVARRSEVRSYARPIFASALFILIVIAAILARIPVWMPAVYFGVGLGSFLAYLEDKRRAGAQQWRLSEVSLHILDLAGGIVGGLAAQFAFRHKTKKTGFGLITIAVATTHLLWLAGLATGAIAWSEVADLPRLLVNLVAG